MLITILFDENESQTEKEIPLHYSFYLVSQRCHIEHKHPNGIDQGLLHYTHIAYAYLMENVKEMNGFRIRSCISHKVYLRNIWSKQMYAHRIRYVLLCSSCLCVFVDGRACNENDELENEFYLLEIRLKLMTTATTPAAATAWCWCWWGLVPKYNNNNKYFWCLAHWNNSQWIQRALCLHGMNMCNGWAGLCVR